MWGFGQGRGKVIEHSKHGRSGQHGTKGWGGAGAARNVSLRIEHKTQGSAFRSEMWGSSGRGRRSEGSPPQTPIYRQFLFYCCFIR